MMTVAVHARWSGQAARAAAMRMFLEHATQQPGVAFMRRSGHRPLVARHLPAGVTPLRAGIIGGGWIARVHVPAIDAAPGVELVAACDIDADRAEAIAGPRGARAYTRWEEMLEREELDVLWVCTPPLHHRAPVVAALAAGVHVYLEKPIARTLADAEAIVAAAAAGPAVCAVGYQWHASELLEEAREALAGSGWAMLVGRNFGPVAGRPWFMDQAQGGGQILERGSHHIDLQRAMAGEMAAVEALAGTVGLAQPEPGSVADAIVARPALRERRARHDPSVWSRDGQPELYATDILATDATIQLELGPEAFRVTGVARRAGALERARRADGALDRPLPRCRPRRRPRCGVLPAGRRPADARGGARVRAGAGAGDEGRRMRLGFVGAGAIARRHCRGARRPPGAIVAAVCDAQVDGRARWRRRRGATAYTDWEAMFEAEPLDARLRLHAAGGAPRTGPGGVRARGPGVPREAAGALARRRRGDRRGLARRAACCAPSATSGAASTCSTALRAELGGARAGPAREPELRADRARAGAGGSGSATRGRAAASCSSSEATTSTSSAPSRGG